MSAEQNVSSEPDVSERDQAGGRASADSIPSRSRSETSDVSKPHSSADEAKRQAIRVLAGGPVLYPEEYALIAREYLNLFEQLNEKVIRLIAERDGLREQLEAALVALYRWCYGSRAR